MRNWRSILSLLCVGEAAPGRRVYTVWQAERGSRTVDVTVSPSGPTRVDVTL